MTEVKKQLDVDALRSRAVTMPYPHISIVDLNKCVPLVISTLEEGDVPLLGTLNGVTKIVKKISKSSMNINKLIRVTELELAITEDDVNKVTDLLSYMEVAPRWI